MCRPVRQEVEFAVPPRTVYDAYLDSREHSRFTGQRARMSRRVGGWFTAGDTYISGCNLELKPARRIVQAWRASEWPEGAFSILRLDLRPRGRGTVLTVEHVGIPEEFHEGVDSGWQEFYWRPMQEYFGERPRARGASRRPGR
jgi:activator of HSP90 ATPase